MAKRLIAGLLALTLALGLTACSKRSEESQPVAAFGTDNEIISDAVDASAGRTAENFGLAYQPSAGLNPYTCDNLTNRTAMSLLYEGLFVVTADFTAEPVLCDSFSCSADQLVYTVRLSPGVTFSDGTALTAWDVVASYQAAENSSLLGSRMRYFYDISVADDLTVTFTLGTPYENLPLLLDIPIVKSGTAFDDMPIGTGPYQVAGSEGDWALELRSDWWQTRDPAVSAKKISLVETATPVDVRDDFEYGVTGVVCTDPNAAGYVDYRCDFELWNCPTAIMDYIGFNTNDGVFSTPGIRKEFTYLVDRETIAMDLYKGYGAAASLPASPLSPFYDSNLAAEYDYDPQAFRDALRELDLPQVGGTFLVCSSDSRRVQAAQMIADTAKQYGLDLTVKSLASEEYSYALYAGEYDLYFGEVRLSPDFDLSGFFNGSELCIGGISSSDLVGECQAALSSADNYYSLHKSVMEQGMLCPVLFKSYAVYATRGIVENLVPAVDNVFHMASGRSLNDATPPSGSGQPEDESEETSESDSTAE